MQDDTGGVPVLCMESKGIQHELSFVHECMWLDNSHMDKGVLYCWSVSYTLI